MGRIRHSKTSGIPNNLADSRRVGGGDWDSDHDFDLEISDIAGLQAQLIPVEQVAQYRDDALAFRNQASGFADDAAQSATDAAAEVGSLAATDGATKVGMADGSTVQDALDGRVKQDELSTPATVPAYAFSAVEAQSIFDNAFPLQDYTALRAYSGRAKGIRITGLYVSAVADGIAGNFKVDPTDTTSADNGGTIIVDAVGRRWKRTGVTQYNVRWFGATGLGFTDDAPAINSTIVATPTGGTVFHPPGVYRVSQVNVSKAVNILGDGAGSTYILVGSFAPLDADAIRYTLVAEARNLFIRNLTIGNFGSAVGRSGHGLNVSNAPLINFTVENCNIGAVGETGWGIYSSSRGFGGGTIHNNTIGGNVYLRQSTDGLVISKNTIFGSRGWGIDIEIELGSYNTTIRDNLIVCKDGALALQDGSQVLIENNQFEQPTGTVNAHPLSSHVVIYNASGNVNRTRNIIFRRNNFGGGTGIGRDIWIIGGSDITIQENRLNRGSGAHIAINAAAVNTRLVRNQYDVAGAPVTSGAQIAIADSGVGTMFEQWRDGNVDLGYSDGYPVPLYGKQLKFRAKGTAVASFVLGNDSGSLIAYASGGSGFVGASGGLVLLGSSTAARTFTLDVGGSLIPGTDNAQALGTAALRYSEAYVATMRFGAGSTRLTSGAGSPEGVLAAAVGSIYTRTDGGAGTTLYVKESGVGNTGWIAK